MTWSIMTKEDVKSVEVPKETSFRSGNQYITDLFWKEANRVLPNNKPLVLSCLYNLERKLAKLQHIRKMYTRTVKKFNKKWYVQRLSDKKTKTISPRTSYIICHGIININKPNKQVLPLVKPPTQLAHNVLRTSTNSYILLETPLIILGPK